MIKVSPAVLFNASVILAGINSPNGGSGKLLSWVKQNKINGVISEVILDEILRNAPKIGFDKEILNKKVRKIFRVEKEPKQDHVDKFKGVVINFGDAHVLASSKEIKADYLVTLDQKHLLVLQDRIKEFKIVTPGQLINDLKLSPI